MMIKKVLFAIGSLCSAALLLSACGGVHKIKEHAITKHKLSNGQIVYVGIVKPTPAWGCVERARKRYTWHDFTRGALTGTKQGPFGSLQNEALKDAGKMDTKMNYIDLVPPHKFSVGGINLKEFDHAHAFFYQCKKINVD